MTGPQAPTAWGAPTVTYTPTPLAGEWVFTLANGGHRQRLRTTELQALYRDCDRALVAHRKAEAS